MRILHVLHTPRAEGTVKLALDWLSEPGLQQDVLVLNPSPAEMTTEIARRAAGFEQGVGFPSGAAKFPWMIHTVWRCCRRRRPDLVICWSNGFSPWVLGGAWLARVPGLITHAGNPPAWNLGGKVHTVLCTFAAWAMGGRMVCCSQHVAREFARSSGVFSSVLRVVYNCAPVAAIRAEASMARRMRRDRRPQVIMVATLEPHKDHATLLRALPAVAQAVPGVHVRLAGDGSLRQQLEELTHSLGLADTVTFLGSRRDVPSLLGESDLFVFSTTGEEGLGTVLVEALASGLPIVASDVPACREVLEEGKWGTLVPAGNSAALAAALIAALRAGGTNGAGDPNGAAFPKGAGGPPSAAQAGYLERYNPSAMIQGYLSAVSR
jgi:glycosyltransferase involved in cell wall biosynthesis